PCWAASLSAAAVFMSDTATRVEPGFEVMAVAWTLAMRPAPRRPTFSMVWFPRSAETGLESVEFRVPHRDVVLRLGVSARVHIRDELLERVDAFLLQAGVLCGEVAIGLGMARLVAVGAAQHILGKQVLR